MKQLEVVHGARLFLTHLRDAQIITLSSVEPSVYDPRSVVGLLSVDAPAWGTGDVTLHNYSIYIRELLRRLGDHEQGAAENGR
jgi:hypothetical protein